MRKLLTIQYLRAVAATGVLIFHAGERFGYPFATGAFGVDLFFVISGFLMVAITDEDTSARGFMRDRVERIVPIYWLATSVMVVGALIGLFPNMKLEWWHTLASYLFLPAPSPSVDQSWPVLIPGWTLNYEMFFYAIFAGLLFIRGQAMRVALLSLVLCALVIGGSLVNSASPALAFYSDAIILEFALGAWVGLAWRGSDLWTRIPASGLLLAGAALFLAAAALPGDLPRTVLYGIPSTLLLIGALALEAQGGPRQFRLMELLGDASYSIYLWHGLAVSVVAMIAGKLGLHPLVGFVVAIVGGLIGGVISYLLIEKPVTRYLKRARGRVAAPVAAKPV